METVHEHTDEEGRVGDDAILDHQDSAGDRIRVVPSTTRDGVLLVTCEEGDQAASVWIDPRSLRDALSAHLGEAGGLDEQAILDAALLSGEHVSREKAVRDLHEAREHGYRQGVEAGRAATLPRSVAAFPGRPVSAVEVEIFREARDAGEPGSRIRDGLAAVEQYRAWKEQQ